VGGLVFHPNGKQVLCISEAVDLPRIRWKLPGGLVDKGETIAEAG
jgi:8-oxo-dGTP pyrophosphatase MutT (NUDIX family)